MKRQQEGYTYQQEQSFEVSKLAAQNEGVGNFSAAGIGLGMMGGIAGGMGATMAGVMSNTFAPMQQAQMPQASGVPPAQTAQAPQAATAPQPAPVDEMAVLKQKIEKLKMMKESGLISDEEWEAERKKLLSAL